ncbi:MAG TPA: cytochrome b/b6 domain-containing protein, partial [Sphingomicrobium sp.]|nr:cytochrome b/b6 domain-containing protein [Sphingomicrobium sp.]
MTEAAGEAAPEPRKVDIWDLPTRLFHWTLVGLIAFSWWTAEEHEDDLHIWSGLAVLSLLIFRILWGIFGSSTARFASFVRGPRAVLGYLQGQWRGIGHNPLGALSVVALLGLTAMQVGLGLIASDEDGLMQGPLATLVNPDTSEAAAELHDDLFDFLLIFIALHVAAILFYKLRGKSLLRPMITGKGDPEEGVEPMKPGKGWVAILCLIVAIGITRWVIA